MIQLLSVVLAVLYVGCSQPQKLTTFDSSTLKVLSYNIHHANPPSEKKTHIDLDTIAAVIRSSGADLVAIQELDSITERSNRVYQLKVLADKLNMHFHFERTIPYEGGAYGIGILSKYPLETVKAYELPHVEGTEPRKLLLASIKYKGSSVIIGCTHIDYKTKEIKQRQTQTLLDIVNRLDNEVVIIAGDFNATPDDESIRQLRPLLSDAGAENDHTIPVRKPVKKIDYIFYKKSDKVILKNSRVMAEHHYESDHLPVLAAFEIK